ncbi:hypothetical protein [Emticicia agri]|uniref:Uncharacterized protein n=1 Tax=Emticicia agri TaxID=2492393 RepID=A0A4Q5LTM7_9BACT|nr:hypothetical protein [Emticicia agri]RYU92986.1 hypothetical protein EWM59_24420 [Emticicia agri]
MNTIENTPRREDEIPATQQQGNQNSSQQAQQNNANQGQQGQGNTGSTQQGANQNSGEQEEQSAYRGQGGEEFDVDASDAVNRQADYSGNSERDIEDSTLDSDRDIESQRDSDQNITPGDKAPNKDFNR